MESIECRAALVIGARRGIRAAVARRLAAAGVRLGLASKALLVVPTRRRTHRIPEAAFRPVTEASWG